MVAILLDWLQRWSNFFVYIDGKHVLHEIAQNHGCNMWFVHRQHAAVYTHFLSFQQFIHPMQLKMAYSHTLHTLGGSAQARIHSSSTLKRYIVPLLCGTKNNPWKFMKPMRHTLKNNKFGQFLSYPNNRGESIFRVCHHENSMSSNMSPWYESRITTPPRGASEIVC